MRHDGLEADRGGNHPVKVGEPASGLLELRLLDHLSGNGIKPVKRDHIACEQSDQQGRGTSKSLAHLMSFATSGREQIRQTIAQSNSRNIAKSPSKGA